MNQKKQRRFPDIHTDITRAKEVPDTPQTRSPTYTLPIDDHDFLTRDELRPVRLQLELLKPEMLLEEAGVESTAVLFGGARIRAEGNLDGVSEGIRKLAPYYEEARKFAELITTESLKTGNKELVICTGGGPGVMEAGCLGAQDAGGRSVTLNIVLPHEQAPNAYATPELCFNFHYFAIRKMHFLMRAKVLAAFPGGFGTLDELFETLTLVQTHRMTPLPILLFGREFWESIINWEALKVAGTISPEDLDLFKIVDHAEEGFEMVKPVFEALDT